MNQPQSSTAPDLKLRVIVVSLVLLIALGTVLFKFLEPFTWIQSFYFTVSTMTTVGFGDLVPSSDSTRLVAALYMLLSVSLYVSFITFLGSHLLELRTRQLLERLTKDVDITDT
jgi:voltage-gated potassium channel Kch